MRTTKIFTLALAVISALLFTLDSQAGTIYQLGETVYSVCSEEQLSVDSLANPIEAYVHNNTVYLYSSADDSNTLYTFGDVQSFTVKGGEIEIVTDYETTYIYTLGDNVEIESFLDTI